MLRRQKNPVRDFTSVALLRGPSGTRRWWVTGDYIPFNPIGIAEIIRIPIRRYLMPRQPVSHPMSRCRYTFLFPRFFLREIKFFVVVFIVFFVFLRQQEPTFVQFLCITSSTFVQFLCKTSSTFVQFLCKTSYVWNRSPPSTRSRRVPEMVGFRRLHTIQSHRDCRNRPHPDSTLARASTINHQPSTINHQPSTINHQL